MGLKQTSESRTAESEREFPAIHDIKTQKKLVEIIDLFVNT